MNFIIGIICGLGICTIGGIILIVFKNNEITKRIEVKLEAISNSITFIGVFFTIITLIVTGIGVIYTIREPQLDVNFKTPHNITWREENGNKPLYLVQDVDGHIDYEMTQPGRWHISFLNSGNKTINKVTIKITFSDIYFINQQYDFDMVNHLYGHGGYATLERTFNSIEPDSEVSLPYFPFEIANIYKNYGENDSINLENTKMILDIYIDDKKSKTVEYSINILEDSTRKECYFKEYVNGVNSELVNIEKDFAKLQGANFLAESLIRNAYELNIDEDEYDNYDKMYSYYINKLECYNSSLKSESKVKALFWGRVYYLCASNVLFNKSDAKYTINDIENMIRNDIEYGKINNNHW